MMMISSLRKADAIELDSFIEATKIRYEIYKTAGSIIVNGMQADAQTDKPDEEWKNKRSAEVFHPRLFHTKVA